MNSVQVELFFPFVSDTMGPNGSKLVQIAEVERNGDRGCEDAREREVRAPTSHLITSVSGSID